MMGAAEAVSTVEVVSPVLGTEGGAPSLKGVLDPAVARGVRRFHASFPEYSPTPLRSLDGLAGSLGLAGFYVKDESFRFGLNAFKVLGGSYAIGRYLADRFGIDPAELSQDVLASPALRSDIARITFVTATDGNHGRGVAWTAKRLGAKSVVYMPKGSAPERLANIRACGADAAVTDLNYDDAVRLAARRAEENGWVVVQDTAWEGYEDIPRWIIQGYLTMSLEVSEQLPVRPTHVFVQAGVGSLATSVAGFFSTAYRDDPPLVCVVEPTEASCIFDTAKVDDGRLHPVAGDMPTIMAGLACGEPCTVGWPYLRSYASHFLRVSDEFSAFGMRVLGNPLPGDERVVSGESGAVTAGVVAAIMGEEPLAPIMRRLNLTSESVVVCLSTEGDTDRSGYRDVVWKGSHPLGKVVCSC